MIRAERHAGHFARLMVLTRSQPNHAAGALIKRRLKACVLERLAHRFRRQAELFVAAHLGLPNAIHVLMEHVVHLNMFILFLQEAREDPVSVRSNWNEACIAGWKLGVVAEGCDEPAVLSQTTADGQTEFPDLIRARQMREGVAHAEHKVHGFIRREILAEAKQVAALRGDRQAGGKLNQLIKENR